MAQAIIMRNVLRRFSASDSGEVFVMVIGKAGDSKLLLLDNACRMLRLKAEGWVALALVMLPLLCVCDGDFIVVVDKGSSGRSLRTVVGECEF
jgi:hypothetical protein